jgi:hypothetical protein
MDQGMAKDSRPLADAARELEDAQGEMASLASDVLRDLKIKRAMDADRETTCTIPCDLLQELRAAQRRWKNAGEVLVRLQREAASPQPPQPPQARRVRLDANARMQGVAELLVALAEELERESAQAIEEEGIAGGLRPDPVAATAYDDAMQLRQIAEHVRERAERKLPAEVSVQWVLGFLAGQSFPESGSAYEAIKRALLLAGQR